MDKLSTYFIIINTITFMLFTIDKNRAKARKWRIPESWLFFASLIGGALGGQFAMISMKHKTKKVSFLITMPILIIFNFLTWFYLTTFIQ